MSNSDTSYIELVRHSLALAWRTKILWVFGVFVGGAAPATVGINIGDDSSSLLGASSWSELLLVPIALGLIGVFALIMLTARAVSEGALIHAWGASDVGQGVSFGDSLGRGLRHGVTMFFLQVITVALVLISSALGLALPFGLGMALHPMLGVLVGLVTFPAMLVAYAITIPLFSFSMRIVMRERLGVFDSLAQSANLIQRHLGTVAMIGLVRIGFLFMVSLASMLIGMFVLLPALVLGAIAQPIGMVLLMIMFLPIGLAVSGYLGCSGSYYWTMAFDRLLDEEVT